ncbi:VOC family protein [Nocardioides yefusunii]|uniref:VOC family protein n=1 Tax=Nocardioides yefusunii TaxID=2500546 RepID=A0ABW1QSD0_9ACTN|nr:VOC family protein [Nocardioides yefusunii]
MTHLPRVNHVGISVADLDAARTFWIDGLGALEHGAFSWPVGTTPADDSLATSGTAADVVLLRTDAAFMELFAFSSPTPQRRDPRRPGVVSLAWAVEDLALARSRALAHGASMGEQAHHVRCPDGTDVHLVLAGEGPTGLVAVQVQVEAAAEFPYGDVAGPVVLDVVGGALAPDATGGSNVDLGVNHICLDVDDAHAARAAGQVGGRVRWHHEVTESSGGIAAVCYGTTHDGVLVELLESRTEQAFFSRTRLGCP